MEKEITFLLRRNRLEKEEEENIRRKKKNIFYSGEGKIGKYLEKDFFFFGEEKKSGDGTGGK